MKKIIKFLTAVVFFSSLSSTVISCETDYVTAKLTHCIWLNNNNQIQNIELFFNTQNDLNFKKIKIKDGSNSNINLQIINISSPSPAIVTIDLFIKGIPELNTSDEGTLVPTGDTIKISYANNFINLPWNIPKIPNFN